MATLTEEEVRSIVVALIITPSGIEGPDGVRRTIVDRGAREMFVEIGRAESAFDTNAVGAAGEIGIWQIHPVHFPALESKGIVADPEINLKNPIANAAAARYVYEQQGFRAWTTAEEANREVVERGNAELEANEQRANAAIEEIMGKYDFGPIDLITRPGEVIGNLAEAGFGWAEGLKKFFEIILDPEFWKRIGIGVLGALVIIAALFFYNKDAIVETGKAIK